ncbi:MAG: site-specific integrase [Clostridiales bacterium]|nr:site-specific integrase [Clostridiales bacterium]
MQNLINSLRFDIPNLFIFSVIAANPTEGVLADINKTYSHEKPKRHSLTIQEQEAFINFVAASQKYSRLLPLFTVFLGTGCRVGELTGLRWEDCDFEDNTISINHNLLYNSKPDGKFGFYITTPKTSAGTRIIPMLKDVRNALLFERKRQMAEGFNQTVVDGYKGFIFENANGSLYYSTTINKLINKITETINGEEALRAEAENREPLVIRHFSVHSLRHTFCTRFCENETNLKVIQEIMGHANISTTMDIYAEATQEKKMELFANLEGKIKII